MQIDIETQTVIIMDDKVRAKVIELLVESGHDFRVIDEDNYWMLQEFVNELEYQSSYQDSGC